MEEYPIVKPIFLSGSAHPEAVENSETVPLLCCATQKKERLYEAVGELSLAFSGRALAPLPHPPRASTKTKTWLWMVGLV